MNTQFKLTDSAIDKLFKVHSHLDRAISETTKAALVKAAKPANKAATDNHGDVRPFNRILGHMLEEPRKWENSIKAIRGFIKQYCPGLDLKRNGLEHRAVKIGEPTILEFPIDNILDWFESRPEQLAAKEERVAKSKATRETKAAQNAAILEAAIGNEAKLKETEEARVKAMESRDKALALNEAMGEKNKALADQVSDLLTENAKLKAERDNLLRDLALANEALSKALETIRETKAKTKEAA